MLIIEDFLDPVPKHLKEINKNKKLRLLGGAWRVNAPTNLLFNICRLSCCLWAEGESLQSGLA